MPKVGSNYICLLVISIDFALKSSIIWSYLAHPFKTNLEREKRSPLKKVLIFSCILGNGISSSNIKKFLIFSQKKAFLVFWEMETPKKFVMFQEMELSYISGNGNPKKRFI